ncbi:DNA cytosine methyltransferase [Fusobacterium necrophorum]|uniref:DNA cytosine methyltransferase n=1 Tax=Fusobacterium necrophorum TaxID=859 RepID=UPI00254FE936|nr:DNA cytosine methyltransferase [Fusobacterium necrophorum]MDK4516849.1 DNA cytosine methyltransferase [Fusobacterium necrophorum]
MKKIAAIDLFCGIGGLTYGLKSSGINVVAGIDFDETCYYSYEKNNKSKFLHRDISTVTGEELLSLFGSVDTKILVGCAPCQPFSSHQKDKFNRKKHKDWGLLYEFLRLVKETSPDIVSMENVPNLQKEEVFFHFVEGLEKEGYFVTFRVHNASNYGVPQRRNRLLLLASKRGEISFLNLKEEEVTVRDTIANLPVINAGNKINLADPIHISSSLTEINLKRIRHSKPNGTWKDWSENLLPNCYKKKSGKSYTSVYGRMSWDEVSPTLTTQFTQYGTGRFGHPEQDRAISLREGALLQSFPRDYEFIKPGEKFSSSNVAKHIGNAVPPKLGEYIGKCILFHIKNLKEFNHE